MFVVVVVVIGRKEREKSRRERMGRKGAREIAGK